MRSKEFSNKRRGNYNGWLFSVVFTTKSSLLLVVLLFVSFLIQPIHKTMASEPESDSDTEEILSTTLEKAVSDSQGAEQNDQEADSNDSSTDVSQTTASDVSQPEEPISDEELTEQETKETEEKTFQQEQSSEDAEIVEGEVLDGTAQVGSEPEPEPEQQVTTGTGEETVSATSPDENSEQTTEESNQSEEEAVDGNTPEANTSSDDTNITTEGGSSASPSNDNIDEPVSDEETGSETDMVEQVGESQTTTNTSGGGTSEAADTSRDTTDDLIDGEEIERGVTDLVGTVVNDAVTLARQLVTEENFYQFSRQSCVAVGDGTYHCTTKERSAITQDTTVFSSSGENGNMEIFMRNTKGELLQLTDNEFDDTSPDIDAASMQVVWQRMIDGRHQIISYDLRERKETQLTFSRTNSMEPKVSQNGIVWQEWDGNDWEIMFFDGTVMNQITDNDAQDVTPTIEDGYILWSVLGGLTPEAKVYTIATEQTMTITGHDGGTVANPRFVLVYDTKFDNGDVITQGFDPVTGLATPISAKPAEKPFDIPEPDPVGEIRALLQNKSNQKDTEVVTTPVADGDKDLDLQLASDENGEVLNLMNAELADEEAEQVISPEEASDELILTEYDLVISDESSSTNSVINKKYNLGTTTASSTQ